MEKLAISVEEMAESLGINRISAYTAYIKDGSIITRKCSCVAKREALRIAYFSFCGNIHLFLYIIDSVFR